jgi:predicted transcriptional regulator
MTKDFVCTSANDGTHLIRPITARAEVFWQSKGFFKYVIDNNADFYIIKSVDSEKICNEIRQNNMDFTS